MAYAIVQTTENRKPYLTIVPNNLYIENGFTNFINRCADGIAEKSEGIDALYWPPEKVSDLLNQPESTPQPTWKIMKCKIKRINLEWKVANEMQEQMMTISETENDMGPGLKKKRIIDRMKYSGLTTGKFKSQHNSEILKDLLKKKNTTKHKSSSIDPSETMQRLDLIRNIVDMLPDNATSAPTYTTSTDLPLKNILDTLISFRNDR